METGAQLDTGVSRSNYQALRTLDRPPRTIKDRQHPIAGALDPLASKMAQLILGELIVDVEKL
jgi:hypothetical protein